MYDVAIASMRIMFTLFRTLVSEPPIAQFIIVICDYYYVIWKVNHKNN